RSRAKGKGAAIRPKTKRTFNAKQFEPELINQLRLLLFNFNLKGDQLGRVTLVGSNLRKTSKAMRDRKGSRAVRTERRAGAAAGSPMRPSERAASRRTSSPAPSSVSVATSAGTPARLPIWPSETAAARRTNSFSAVLLRVMRLKKPEPAPRRP